MITKDMIRRRVIKQLTMGFSILGFTPAFSHDLKKDKEVFAIPPNKLMEKLEDIDAVVSECYGKLHSTSGIFKQIVETKDQLNEIKHSIEVYKTRAGSEDEITLIRDQLNAVKELLKRN